MASTLVTDTDTTVDFLRTLFEQLPLENLSVRLWDGSHFPDAAPRAATVVLNHPGALRAMFAEGTAKSLAEAYLRGDIDISGDIEAAIDLATALEAKPVGWLTSLEGFLRLRRLPGASEDRLDGRLAPGLRGAKHTPARDREAVTFHYDLSNEFYRLWLDERMVYSCAYFENPDETLDAAQRGKLDHICRKLRLWPGQHLLDIGCGWGGLAVFAAKHYKVHVTGVTLSERQAQWAVERVREERLENLVTIEVRDYRELRSVDGFDAIASVGMAEHVGRDNLPEYFAAAWKLLRAGGVFLNHAIGEGRKPQRFRGPSFVDEYVFPDSDIPPLPVVAQAAAGAGFEIRDVENLREHYTLTLRHWVRRLEAAHEQALAYVSEPTYRVWRLYMAGSAHGFNCGDLAVYQTLLSKPTFSGSAHLPLTRKDWYV